MPLNNKIIVWFEVLRVRRLPSVTLLVFIDRYGFGGTCCLLLQGITIQMAVWENKGTNTGERIWGYEQASTKLWQTSHDWILVMKFTFCDIHYTLPYYEVHIHLNKYKNMNEIICRKIKGYSIYVLIYVFFSPPDDPDIQNRVPSWKIAVSHSSHVHTGWSFKVPAHREGVIHAVY